MATPSTQELEQICSIAGYPIYKWTADQLRMRSKMGSMDGERTPENLSYLANKNAWVRVVSSIDLNKSIEDGAQLTKHIKSIVPTEIEVATSGLSKNYILYGGVSSYGGGLRSGIGSNGSYGMLGGSEVKAYGYKPMPGITNMTVETTGRLGSMRQATIHFKVWDKQQLDIMDTLYFRLGYSIILEWGHSKYYDNYEKLQTSENYMIDPYTKKLTIEDILIHINYSAQQSYGNYGGMLGVITHFDFSYTQDGGYDCTVKALSLGMAFGNMPINRASILSKAYENQLDNLLSDKRAKKIEEEKKKVEEKDAKARTALYEKLSPDKWALILQQNSTIDYKSLESLDPRLSNAPISTLLFNTKNISGDIEKSQITPSTPTNADVARAVSAIRQEPGYDFNKVRTSVRNYKDTHNITYSNYVSDYEIRTVTTPAEREIENTILTSNYYFIEDNGKGDMIYSQKLRKYITGGKKTFREYFTGNKPNPPNETIKVTIDTDRLEQIINDNKTARVRTLAEAVTKRGFFYGKDYFPNNQDEFFLIQFIYPKTNTTVEDYQKRAIGIFTSQDTQYIVEEVGARGDNPLRPYVKLKAVVPTKESEEYVLELGLITGLPAGDNNTYTADLRLISSIIYPTGFEDLTLNKAFQDYTVAEANIVPIEQQVSTIEKGLDFEITELKKTLEAESAIEIMLKSTLLYILTGKTSEANTFYKTLFSDGAYSEYFKDGIPTGKSLPKDALFDKYVKGNMTAKERLLVNLLYGNNHKLMACEDVVGGDGKTIKNMLDKVPTVDFDSLFYWLRASYGEAPVLDLSSVFQGDKQFESSAYMKLGWFLLMLNHTGVLYISNEDKGVADVITPMSYIDFNPSTNFYLSSVNQISVDPTKFIVKYAGTKEDFTQLFDSSLLNKGKDTIKVEVSEMDSETGKLKKLSVSDPVLFSPEKDDVISNVLPNNKLDSSGKEEGAYVGRLMDVMVNINYLIDLVKKYATESATHEAYFQTVIERLLEDLNKSMGAYNAFRLSYSDSSNCYYITDDQIQPADPRLISEHTNMKSTSTTTYELPVYGKGSIARSMEFKTDVSSRITSMIAIAANPTSGEQVGLGRDSSDFGIYNLGTQDRYKRRTLDSRTPGPDKNVKDNNQMAEIAANFNKVVKTIYSTLSGDPKQQEGKRAALGADSISRAVNYYIERMSYVKNTQSGSAHSLIIPMKSAVTMDGISTLYPFQMYTLPEDLMPYRYSTNNLGKKVGFSISKMTHTFDNNQWVTGVEGFMTLVKDADAYKTDKPLRKTVAPVKPTTPPTNGFTPVDTTSQKDTIQYIMRRLRGAGYSDIAVASIIGNLKQENITFNPTVRHPTSGAYGLGQWLGKELPLTKNTPKGLIETTPGGRLYRLQKKRGFDTLPVQVDFIIEELDSTEKFAGSKLRSSTTLAQAITAMTMYERFSDVSAIILAEGKSYQKAYESILATLNSGLQPTKGEWGKRIGYAQDIYNRILSGEYKY